MDHVIYKLLIVLAVTMICYHCVDGQSHCGQPTEISHGSNIVTLRGFLVQYVCDRNYHLYGRPLLSCVKGVWKGTPPQCISSTCGPAFHPLHSDRQVTHGGAVIRYTCRDGFTLEGNTEIYCQGQQWSSSTPECREINSRLPESPEIVVSTPPDRTDLESKNSTDIYISNVPIAPAEPPGPRFVSQSDNYQHFTQYENMVKNGAISLFKEPASDDSDSAEAEPPSRERNMPPGPVDHLIPPRTPSVSPAVVPSPYSRFTGPGIPPDRRFHWPYALDRRGMPYSPPRSPYIVPFFGNRMYPNQRAMPPMFPQNQYYNIPNQRMSSSHIEMAPLSRSNPPHDIIPQDASIHAQRNGVERQPTGFEPTPPPKVKVPPQTSQPSDITPTRNRKGCSTPRKPLRGYYETLPLPRDYEGEAMYFVKYHCQAGLSLIEGDRLSYCMKNGQWEGKLPRCARIIKCGKGYIKQGGTCVDLNECAENNGGCAQTCLNFNGGHRCSCLPGYRTTQTNDCADIDECERSQCQQICRNTPGSFECSCETGYVVSQFQSNKCVDVNECVEPENRPCDHLCQNTIGSYRCACKPNFRLDDDGRSCVEVCQPGYAMKEGDLRSRKTCVDEDECAEHNGLGNCEHICNNTAGSYFCSCNVGYTINSDGQSCADINECEDASPCSHDCTNTEGSYLCSCPTNQVISEDGLCLGCIEDYYFKNGSCVACPEDSETGRVGATSIEQCNCIRGYQGSPHLGIPCSDVDECSDSNYGCSHRCVNTPGSVVCVCAVGYLLDIDGRTCVDEDECLSHSGVCGRGNQCRNTEGSYICICMRGFRISRTNPKQCIDVNECSVRNGGCQSRCHNLQPGYRCSCYGEKILARDGKTCVQMGRTCSPLKAIPNGRILPKSSCLMVQNVTVGKVCFYVCNQGYRVRGVSKVRCGENGWSRAPPDCLAKDQCLAIKVPAGVRVTPSSCSTSNTLRWRTCIFSCETPSHTLKGNRTTRCLPGNHWQYEAPTCMPTLSSEETVNTCAPLATILNGRLLPLIPCARVSNVATGRVCFYVCKRGYKLRGMQRVTCNENGWSSRPPTCVADDMCPALKVPVGVRVTPPACATNNTLRWSTCVFSCDSAYGMMNGSRTTRCLPGSRWQNNPPTCVSRLSLADGASDIPWIKCPMDMNVRLAPGRSRVFVQVLRPITNMNITEYRRSDGVRSINIFMAGITRLVFTAYNSNRSRVATCTMQVNVQDREAPSVARCPMTIQIESTHQYPERAWKHPLFRDNVGVVSVKESRLPPGVITWGSYNVSYIARDAAGNMAECSFKVTITRQMSRNQGIMKCGSPSGPRNGSPNCEPWARGIYCDPTCKPGYVFERIPMPYVCGEDGVWHPGRAIPDCMDIRYNRIPSHSSEAEPMTTEAYSTETTSATMTTAPSIVENRNRSTSPVRILKKPTFRLIPLDIRPQARSRVRPAHPTLIQNVDSDRTHIASNVTQQNETDCPLGQVPETGETDRRLCVNCPKGYYRPRIRTAKTCVPCSPGFYQDKVGQSYCSRCPNLPNRSMFALRHLEELRSLTALEQCIRVDAYIGGNRRNNTLEQTFERRRKLFRARYHQFRL